MWDKLSDPFPNFNACAGEAWEWKSNFALHSIEYVITYPCFDKYQPTLINGIVEVIPGRWCYFNFNHACMPYASWWLEWIHNISWCYQVFCGHVTQTAWNVSTSMTLQCVTPAKASFVHITTDSTAGPLLMCDHWIEVAGGISLYLCQNKTN